MFQWEGGFVYVHDHDGSFVHGEIASSYILETDLNSDRENKAATWKVT